MNESPSNHLAPIWRRRVLIGILVLLAALVVAGYGPLRDFAVKTTEFMLDKDGAREHILAQPNAPLYFLGLQVLQVIVSPIPGEMSCFLGGVIFGWWEGFLLSSLGLTLGSLVNVSLGRFFERVFLEKIIPASFLDRFESRVKRWGLPTVFILFVFPGAPKDTLCYLFGLSRLPIWSFILVSSVARLPGTLVLSLQGAKIVEGDWTFFFLLTGFGLAVAIPALIFKNRLFRWLGVPDDPKG